ncbi:unnamed protein product [marine sediment metagenome]|uniref:Uncharacterized protein n=1 Tax=marine sediment metagenome TaxID=412755 RepID=X1CUR2_9ZZZZ
MGREGFRTIKCDLEEDLVVKVEETFCITTIEGVTVKARHLSSVMREAVLRGLKVMVVEQRKLRELYGNDLIFLTDTGILFGDALLREKRMKDAGILE